MTALPESIQNQLNLIAEKSDLNCVIRTRNESDIASAETGSGILSGKTLLVKDNISIKGDPVTCSSNVLEGYTSPYNATVIDRIEKEGGFIIGQTNCDEFAMGSSTEYSAFGPSKNPFDKTRVTGGSSGGSGASVAAGLADMALGSDTGGSVRQPASFCGVYGLKPTYGRVSRYGLVAFASSFDQIGPFATSAEDTASLFVTIAGHDPKDATSSTEPVPNHKDCLESPLPKSVGIPRSFLSKGLDPELTEKMKVLESFCEKEGVEVADIDLPHAPYAVSTYYILTMAEASSNLARFDGVRYGNRSSNKNIKELYHKTRSEGFGPEVKRRIMLGTYILSSGYYDAYYAKAQAVRTLIKRDFEQVFEEVDLLVTPVTPTPAFQLGEKIEDPLQMYLSDLYTISASLAGIPAISIPSGFSQKGLPIGLQIMGRPFEEETVLRAARAYEKVTNWRKKRPAIR